MKKTNIYLICILFLSVSGTSQTMFESAEGDGVISFRDSTLSEIKLNLASTAITFGYYYTSQSLINPNRLLADFEIKFKPNDDGLASIVKAGELQPGLKVNGSIGYRRIFGSSFNVIDVYLKPEYSLNGYTIYDTTRIIKGQKSMYNINKNSFGGNVVLNYARSIFANANIYLGAQFGVLSTTNADDLKKGTSQNYTTGSDSITQIVISDSEQIKIGVLKSQIKLPLKIDAILDPGWHLGSLNGSGVNLALMGYFRKNLSASESRLGFGICLLDSEQVSSVFTSIGYELPPINSDQSNGKTFNKGIIFATLGFNID